MTTPRYEVHSDGKGWFFLFDTITKSPVDLLGPWQRASDAATSARHHNNAWESTRKIII